MMKHSMSGISDQQVSARHILVAAIDNRNIVGVEGQGLGSVL